MIRRGFTLIELLVVITILAILAGAALPYVQNYVAEARIAKAKTDLEEIARALAVYETREGEYKKSTVEDLTGRYLNKSPIDPWGKQYVVATDSGIIYSAGPDRKDATANDKLDNINVPYQPPLALVSVKWVDKNQSGAVDIQNVNDEIQLTFSRKLGNAVGTMANAGTIDSIFNVKVDGVNTAMTAVVIPASATIVSDKIVVYPLVASDTFTAGRDSINVIAGHGTIVDQASPTANLCVSDQDVIILPQ